MKLLLLCLFVLTLAMEHVLTAAIDKTKIAERQMASSFGFETENGQQRSEAIYMVIEAEQQSSNDTEKDVAKPVEYKGGYSFISADGYEYQVLYKANKNGFYPYVTAHKLQPGKQHEELSVKQPANRQQSVGIQLKGGPSIDKQATEKVKTEKQPAEDVKIGVEQPPANAEKSAEQEQPLKEERPAKQEQPTKKEKLVKQEQLAKEEKPAKQVQPVKKEILAKQEQAAKEEKLAKQEQPAQEEKLAKQEQAATEEKLTK